MTELERSFEGSSISPRELWKLREQFLSDPAGTDLHVLRPLVQRSWQRSVLWNVDPDGGRLDAVHEPHLDELFLRCAGPVLDDLGRMATDTGAGVFLADPAGVIAGFRGDAQLRRVAERVFPTFGAAMTEDVAGTNAEGTALEEGRTVQIWGAEHFAVGLQDFCCTAVPVRDPMRRSIRGFLSLALPAEIGLDIDPRRIALIVEAAAAQISGALADHVAVRERALLESYLAEVRKRGADSVVVMDDRMTIASRSATELLKRSDYAVLAGYARESERQQDGIEREITLRSGAVLELHAHPVSNGSGPIGSVIRLRESDAAVGRASEACRQDPFGEVVGTSLALRRATELAHTAVVRRVPALLLGEPGSGKRTLAAAMAARLAEEVVTVDCRRAGEGLLDGFADALERGVAVVLTHADAMAPEARTAVLAATRAHEAPSIVMTSETLDSALLELLHGVGGFEITVPPLRKRREDIPLLVGGFLREARRPDARFLPTLMRDLAEADWPGNVAQLREIVVTAAARCRSPQIGPEQLTAVQRSALARGRLSRLEEAELQQIRDALAEAQGNRVRAAELLQIGRSTLYRRMESYGRRGFTI